MKRRDRELLAPLERVRGYRIGLFLPSNTAAERQIVRDTAHVLRERYGGATHSSLASRAAFGGEYGADGEAERDDVVYLFADTLSRQDSRKQIEEFLAQLLTYLHGQYDAAGKSQDTIMASVQRVSIYLASRPVPRDGGLPEPSEEP